MLKRRPSWWFILLAGIATAAGAYVWGRQSAAPAGERTDVWSPGESRRLAALEREVHRLRAATLELSARQQQLAARPSVEGSGSTQLGEVGDPGPEEPKNTDETEALDPEDEKRLALEARSAFLDELEQRLDAEPFDPAWRRETEPAIERVISAQLGAHVSVDEVVCGSSLCRALLSHRQWPRIPNAQFEHFAMNRGGLEPMQIQMDTREEGVTAMYFIRGEGGMARAP